MTQSNDPIIIIGTGLAGYNLAKELRKLDKETPITMITADDGRNYSKPMLSTGFGKNKTADELAMSSAADMAAQLNLTIRTHTHVTALRPDAHEIDLGPETLSYSKLVLAWGAEAIRVPVEGDAQDIVHSVNDLTDYGHFRIAAEGHKRALIMGAGLIGCEFANDMSNGGYDVTVVAPCERIFPTLLPPEAAAAVQVGLESLGVKFHLGPYVSKLERQGDSAVATLSDGTVVETDVVVSAIGLRPRVEMAAAAGLAVNRGIVTNRLLETSAADVYALGDCAEVEGHVLLYVLPLMASARALAKTLTGNPEMVSYGVMPVTVKTPVTPVVVAPPAVGAEGEWTVDGEGLDIQAEFRNKANELLGYALTGAKVVNKVALNKELPAILG
ncbi:MAG TPA: FAD-dependent oxidoreductase [Oceanospirillales bacterium]|nr:FAD-dependent oxidoreductase [Oceanospirillaceae bacterium]HBS41257.1 FAD-dependent oxidoreductase [Oceanospirillales bacterium]|tara:strand:+ start:82962 stop:84119 length:1158 start_codon:yes stop_codon:yes gene_type:complete